MGYIKIEDIETLNASLYFIDMDGVILQSVKAIVEILNNKYKTDFKTKDVKSWNFKCCFPNLKNNEIEELFDSKEFFNIVEPYTGVFDFMNNHKDNIVIITKGNIENIKKKKEWLDSNGFENIKMIGLPLDISKNYINMKGGVFIDDYDKNLIEVNTANYKIMFEELSDREWNRNWEGMKMNSWVKNNE